MAAKDNAPTLQFGDDKFSDGCAIFWKTRVLRLVDQRGLKYVNPDAEGDEWSQVALLARMARVGLAGSSSVGNGGGTFIVSATHLKSKPGAENEARRTEQLAQLMAWASLTPQPKATATTWPR